MIENRKTYFMLIYTTVLTVIALVYGFSTIPNPAMQRELKLDHKRVTDLGTLHSSINKYYLTNSYLPASLSEVKNSGYSYYGELAINDPATKQQYEYIVNSDTTYQLCATFSTDATKEEDVYDTDNYNYSTYKTQFEHTIGRKCFELQAPERFDQNYDYPTPTFYMLPTEALETLPTATPEPGTSGPGVG